MSRSPTSIVIAVALALGCGGPVTKTDPNEPQTARQKQLREAKASGELDEGNASKWGNWRYQGDRKDCYYIVGRRCFKTAAAACKVAACRAPAKCHATGGGPATLTCK